MKPHPFVQYSSHFVRMKRREADPIHPRAAEDRSTKAPPLPLQRWSPPAPALPLPTPCDGEGVHELVGLLGLVLGCSYSWALLHADLSQLGGRTPWRSMAQLRRLGGPLPSGLADELSRLLAFVSLTGCRPPSLP